MAAFCIVVKTQIVIGMCWLVLAKCSKPETAYLEDHCNGTIIISTNRVIKLSNWKNLSPNSDEPCIVAISAVTPYHSSLLKERVRLSLLDLSVPGQPPVCRSGHLDLLNSDGNVFSGGLSLCGTHGAISWDSKANTVYVSATATNSSHGGFFKVLVTAYNTYECDPKNEFCCSNGRCVDTALTCDGYDDCGDNSDEKSGCLLSGPIVAAIVIGAFLLVVCMICVAVFALKRNWTSGWGVGPSLTASSMYQECGQPILSPTTPSIHCYGATENKDV